MENVNQNMPQPEDITAWEKKSFYARLGVSPDATEEEINKAFRKVSVQYHPDKVDAHKELRANYEKIQTLLGEARLELKNRKRKSSKSGQESKKEYTQTNQKQQERKNEFNETEAIQRFIERAKTNSTYHFQIPNIKKEMDDLINKGVKREKLLQSIEAIVIPNFLAYATANSTYYFQIPNIEKHMQELMSLGLKKEELINAISDTVITNFSEYAKKNSSYDFQFPNVHQHKDALLKLGIDESKVLETMKEYGIK